MWVPANPAGWGPSKAWNSAGVFALARNLGSCSTADVDWPLGKRAQNFQA